MVAAGLASLVPALLHGVHLGPYDRLAQTGLGAVPGTVVHNPVASDQITEFAPVSLLASQLVHHAHLPLWNPYNASGLPLGFDFQSAVFGVPALLGYLFPSSLAYTVAVAAKLVIAGTGAFFACRVLGLGVPAAAFAGTAFELSGAFTGWLGWPQAGVFCWLGWLVGAALVVLRTERRLRACIFFSLVTACAVYGGHPEALAMCAVALFVVVLFGLAFALWRARRPAPLAGMGALVLSGLGGLALAAPLVLPGLELARSSVRYDINGAAVLPKNVALNALFAGFSGYPTSDSRYFGFSNYYETAAFVGMVVCVLALVAVLVRPHRPEVLALTVVTAGFALAIFTIPGADFVNGLPFSRQIVWTRALAVVDFCLVVLAAIGLDSLTEHGSRLRTWATFALTTVAGGVVLLVVRLHSDGERLPLPEAAIRSSSFLWPAVSLVVLAGCGAVLVWFRRGRHGRARSGVALVPLLLLGTQTAFGLTATPVLWSSSPHGFAPTPAEQQLARLVGPARVAFASCPALDVQADLGILPEANSAYGVHEVSAYNPILPHAFVTGWEDLTRSAPVVTFGEFCPSVDTAPLARVLGASYVLAAPGDTTPRGTRAVASTGGETLYQVPGAGAVTIGSADPGAAARPVSFHQGAGGALAFGTEEPGPAPALVRVTPLPGWSATIDGRRARLTAWHGLLYSLEVPPGRHQVNLVYRPPLLTLGLGLAGAVPVGYLALGLVAHRRRRRARRVPSPRGPRRPAPPLPR